MLTDNCSFLIKQHLPVHLYVDIDEIQNLKAFGGPSVCFVHDFSITLVMLPQP